MRNRVVSVVAFLGALIALHSAVAAEPIAQQPARAKPASELDRAGTLVRPERSTPGSAADAGLFLPSTLAPRMYEGTAFAAARSGYDASSDAFVARAAAEGSLTDFLALRLEFEHGPSRGPQDRVRVGARVGLLAQDTHGIDGGVALFYDPKDFREEGNIVAGLLAGREFGRLGVFANVFFGGDPEGDDAQLELRLGSSYRLSSALHVGVDARGRYNLSSDAKRGGTLTRDWELQLLPTASLELGSVALVADLGVAAVQNTGPFGEPDEHTDVHAGVLALGGIAGAF
jgi:hypothetical protein